MNTASTLARRRTTTSDRSYVAHRSRGWLRMLLSMTLAAWGLVAMGAVWAQAATVFVEVHVDVMSSVASDANAGSAEAPLATLMEGVRHADENRLAGRATRVVVHPGTYRESLIGPLESRSGAPIVIEAAETGTAIVSGSDVWTEWNCIGRVCTHAWPFAWGLAAIPWPQVEMEPLGRRREMVFVNGTFIEQRLDRFDVMINPGTFHVDERESRLTVHVPPQVDLATAVFEVSVRDQLLRLQGMSDLTIRGLVFEHGNSPLPNTAVRIVDQDNVLVEDVIVRRNNWGGIWFKGNDLVVRNTVSTYNGASGFSAFEVDGILLEGNESSYNNWRGFAGGVTGWAVGEKFLVSRDLTIRDHVSVYNLARGLWIDYNNINTTIERLYACHNLNDGLFIERNQGPVSVIDSTLCNNGRAGLRTSATNGLEIRGNHIEGNMDAQLVISGDLDVVIPDWIDGTVRVVNNRDWEVVDNTLIGSGEANLITTSLPRAYWFDLMGSARFEGNEYVHPRNDAFLLYGGTAVDFESWRREAFQDITSTYRQE